MTDENILEMIFAFEGVDGKYSDHPDDSGGPTRWGITIPVLAQYRRKPVTWEDIMNLSREEAESIYTTRYIAPYSKIAETVRPNVIDTAVNCGHLRAVRLLQQTMGVDVDGKIGPHTIEASLRRDWNPLFTGVRLGFYEDLIVAMPKNMTWRKGWRRRALSFLQPDDSRRMLFRRHSDFMGKAA